MSPVLQALERLDARVPSWDLAGLQSRPCPLCGNPEEGSLLRPDGLPVAYCHSCGLWYVCKLPEQSAIVGFYSGYWQNFRPHDLSFRAAAQMVAQAKILSEHDIRIIRLRALLGGLRGKRILDVGCGLGQFLLEARAQDAEVLGTELSPEACIFVGERLRIPVKALPFERCVAEMEPVDAVVMSDLIEHVTDPLGYIKAACTVLRDRGVLLLLTPNGGAAGDRVATACNWVGFRVDLEHLQYFSPRTIQCLSRDGEWQTEHLEQLGFPGLEGIDRPPRPAEKRQISFRDLLRQVPAARLLARVFRAGLREFAPKPPDPREGSYHLFCILRKTSR